MSGFVLIVILGSNPTAMQVPFADFDSCINAAINIRSFATMRYGDAFVECLPVANAPKVIKR